MSTLIQFCGSSLALYAATYLFVGMVDEKKFADHFSVLEADRRRESGPLSYLKIGVTLIGFGLLMYAAASSIFAFIPESWGQPGEDSGWEYTRQSLQSIFAVVATFGVLPGFEKRNSELVRLPFSILENESYSEELRATHNPELKSRIETRFKKKLEHLNQETTCATVRRISRHEISIRDRRITPNDR